MILLYFEELREVARRQSEATAYYITTDKIERGRERQRERERERERAKERARGTQWKVFCCCVIRLSCCWLQSGTTESLKCRWLLTGLASCVCVCSICVCVCACSSTTTESPSLRALGEGQEEAMAKYGQMTELPESSSSASRPPCQVRSVVLLWTVECETRIVGNRKHINRK